MMISLKRIAAASAVVWLAGCATHYTVDDGRKVNEVLLGQIRTYAQGTQVIRPAIVRSADLHDKDCSTQWELPFDVSTSYAVKSKDDKVAWVRGAGIDEHLRVLAASPAVDLKPGDILTQVDGYHSRNIAKMVFKLNRLRDDGDPFEVKLESGKTVRVTPLKVCRGRTLLAPPGKQAEQQDYHWLQTIHPEQIASAPLTPDEAQWVVLWTQGLSEEGGLRMKTYAYGIGLVKVTAVAALSVATMGAGTLAAGTALTAGASIGGALGAGALAEAPLLAAQLATAAAANSASLHGINWVASTAFGKADKWAFDRMSLLGMDPRAGETLEMKLAQHGATRNAFLLNKDRQKRMDTLSASLPAERQSQADAAHAIDASQPDSPEVQVGTAVVAAPSLTVPLESSAVPALSANQPAPADSTGTVMGARATSVSGTSSAH